MKLISKACVRNATNTGRPFCGNCTKHRDDQQLAAQMVSMSFTQNQLREKVARDGFEK